MTYCLPRTFHSLFALLTLLASTPAALAQFDSFWNVAEGDFNIGANWDTGSVPGMFDYAYIQNGGTATLSSTSGNHLLDQMRVGFDTATSGVFEMTGGHLSPDRLLIGELGTGTVNVMGGELSAGGGSIFIGGTEGSGGQTGDGELNVSGGVVSSGDDFQFGASGTGTFNMSGGWATGVYTVVGKFGTGTWNHSGGVYDQSGGDIEIGDGGRNDQLSTPGPRTGTINLTGGVIQSWDHIGIGNRRGTGTVNVSGGSLAVTGAPGSTLYIGRGMDTDPGDGGATTLRVTGADSIIAVTGSLMMNPSMAAVSSTLVAEITGSTHTTINVAGGVNIANGTLKVELNGYSPVSGDSYTLIQAGADLTAALAAIDAMVSAEGAPALSHATPGSVGSLTGPFAGVDFSLAPLASGLSWEVTYPDNSVLLSVIGTATGLPGDFNNDGLVDAADYTVWRDNLGLSDSALNGNGTGDASGLVVQADYTLWNSSYGSAAPAATASFAVPEPTAVVLLLTAVTGGLTGRRRVL